MSDRISVKDFRFDAGEIQRRKQLVRDLWAGKTVDHVPVHVTVENPEPDCPIREQFLDADKQWQEALAVAGLTWKHVPGGDVVPAVRPDVGCSCLATAFGAKLYWGNDPAQTCGVREPPLKDIEEAHHLAVPSPLEGQLKEGTDRVRRFAEWGEGFISVSLLDMAGGLNVAADLVGCDQLYVAMVENPEAVECLLGKIQELFLAAIAAQIEAAGGQENITTTDFPDCWFPEGRKGHVSDDISASISPAMYERFSHPWHNMVFERYGGGGLHNCGPNPCLEGYLSHKPPPRSVDLSYRFSKNDLPDIKRVFRKRAMVYMGELPSEPEQAVEAYRRIMEQMTPDVIVIPQVAVSLKSDPQAVYHRMRMISEEYAKRMDWGWE